MGAGNLGDLPADLRMDGAIRGGVAAGVGLGFRPWLVRAMLGPAADAARAFASAGWAEPVLLDVGGVGCIMIIDSPPSKTRH